MSPGGRRSSPPLHPFPAALFADGDSESPDTRPASCLSAISTVSETLMSRMPQSRSTLLIVGPIWSVSSL